MLNILRAAAREPLQFSTMGNVTGTVGNSATLTIPFTNVIAGGRDVISPSLTINDAVNPNVSFIPLGAREFATGILTPISASNIELFLHGGWDAEFLLPLIVGGIVCPDGRLLLNSGEYEVEGSTAQHDAFRQFFYDSAQRFSIDSQPAEPADRQTFTVSEERAIALLREGVGAGHTLVSVQDGPRGSKRVTISPARRFAVRGLEIEQLCGQIRSGRGSDLNDARARLGAIRVAQTRGRVIFRSVETIIQYLGESHRVRMREGTIDRDGLNYFNQNHRVQIMFRAESGSPGGGRAVETRFHDTVFYVPRLNLRAGETNDRTLKTLSFLDQLIALQTSESTIRNAQPLIAIQQ